MRGVDLFVAVIWNAKASEARMDHHREIGFVPVRSALSFEIGFVPASGG